MINTTVGRRRPQVSVIGVAYAALCALSAALTLYAYVALDPTPGNAADLYRWITWDVDAVDRNVTVLGIAIGLAGTGVLIRVRRRTFLVAGAVLLCAATRLLVLLQFR